MAHAHKVGFWKSIALCFGNVIDGWDEVEMI